jgi:hypothetical protein
MRAVLIRALKKNIMLRDDEQVIRTEPKQTPPPPTPGLVEKLEALGFRPFGYEW